MTASSSIDANASEQTDKLHTYGFYLQDAIHLTDQWIAVLGGRYTHYQQMAGRGRPFRVSIPIPMMICMAAACRFGV